MDKICPIAQEVMADASLSPETRQMTFAQKVDDAISSTPMKNIMGALATAAPEMKYALMQAGAAEIGRENWTCPAFAELVKVPVVLMEQPQPPEPIVETLDKASIKKTLASARQQTTYCYEKRLMKNPKLAGRILVKFVIGKDGTVTSAAVAKDNLSDKKVGLCVAKVVRSLRFAKPASGVKAISYPFVFTSK